MLHGSTCVGSGARSLVDSRTQGRMMVPMDASVVTLTVSLEAATKPEGDHWLAWCVPLDVTTQAGSKAAALHSLKEAVELWFESCIDRGVLEQALEEAGFQRKKPGKDLLADARPAHAKGGHGHPFSGELESIEISIPAYVAASLLEPCAAR
jgi:predicted RNase H-like HicB family nuclease